jgi:hypothetical protein
LGVGCTKREVDYGASAWRLRIWVRRLTMALAFARHQRIPYRPLNRRFKTRSTPFSIAPLPTISP